MPQRVSLVEPYPKREPYFAHRFLRLLTKTALAMELGDSACWLLTVVVMQEDACRYRRPVLFYQGPLCSLCGWSDERTLIRARSLLIGAGWLHYTPGPIRRPGAYFVRIPAQAEGLEDGPTAEEYPPPYPPRNEGHDGGHDVGHDVGHDEGHDVGHDEGHDGGPSDLHPLPRPIPAPASPPSPGKARTATAAALVRVDPVDKTEAAAALAGGRLYRLLKAFRCTVDKTTRTEWPRVDVTGGKTLHEVAAILWVGVCQQDVPRMPSGFKHAREAWQGTPMTERQEQVRACCEYLGIACPPMKGQA